MIFEICSALLMFSTFAKLEPKGLKDLKNAPLVIFAHDFPKHNSGTFRIDDKYMVRINMTNASPLTKTVYGLEGIFTDPEDSKKIVHRISKERVQIVVKPGKTAYLKYKFSPRMEPADLGLMIVVDYYDSDEPAYKSVGALQKITVVYGDSPFDIQSISIYILFGVATVLLGKYFLGSSSVVQTGSDSSKPAKVGRVKVLKVPKSEKPVAPVDVGEANLEWLPDHVLPKGKSQKPNKRK